MKIDRTIRYALTPDEAVAMSCDPAFQERKCAAAGALDWRVTVTPEPGTTTVRTRRTLPTDDFPAMLRKFLPSGMVSTETFVWRAAPEPDGTRTAALTVDFHGAPATLQGRIRVVPTPDGCEVQVRADFSARVPMIGGRVEKLAAPIILGVVDAEERTGHAWVADGRPEASW